MKAYFDTSAFATILFEDDAWQTLAGWIETRRISGCFSNFGWGEFVSAIGLRVRLGRMPPNEATELLRTIAPRLRGWSRVEVMPADIAFATEILADFALGLKLPDAIHIAAAKRLDLVLVSADIRQVRAAATLGVAAINPLHPDGNRS